MTSQSIGAALAQGSVSATTSGQRLETIVERIFGEVGIEVRRSSVWREPETLPANSRPVVIRNAPYRSIYGHEARIEFLLLLGGRKYLIETKRQTVAGSVDEKLPFVFLNARHNFPGYDFLLILDGEGWKEGARQWIERQAATHEGFDVLSIEGFKIWLGSTLRNAGF